MRVALGIAYRGSAYQGWQSQPGGRTVQDQVERALSAFADRPVGTVSAGRTDAGVHALNQVVHFDTAAGGIDTPFAEDDTRSDPLSRKLELAEEFQRIGDKDGARDLLREVLATASGSAKSKAQAMLDDLS